MFVRKVFPGLVLAGWPFSATVGADELVLPGMRSGDTWTYRITNEENNKTGHPWEVTVAAEGRNVDGNFIITSFDRNLARDRQITNVMGTVPGDMCVGDVVTGVMILEGERCRFSLEPDATWDERSTSGDQQVSMRFRYSGSWEVNAPAGTFKAMVFDIDNRIAGPAGEVRIRRTLWYSPEVRGAVGVVEASSRPDGTKSRITRWLLAFTPGAEATR